MANRFSDIAKQMGAKLDEEPSETSRKGSDKDSAIDLSLEQSESRKQTPILLTPKIKVDEKIPTTRKTTALPLVLDIAIKEAKERRNIANKIKRTKKITEDDVVVEALQLYFRKTENRSFLDAAYEKLKSFE